MCNINAIKMALISGIKINKTSTGKTKSITIDVKRWGSYLEDFLDMIEIDRIKKNDVFVDWDKVKHKYSTDKK